MRDRRTALRRRRAAGHACPQCRTPWALRAGREPGGLWLLVCRHCSWRQVRAVGQPSAPDVGGVPADGVRASEFATDWSHAVHLYGSDSELVDGLAAYLAAGWDDLGVGLVIATPRHRLLLEEHLAARGLAAASRDGRLIMRDAVETLALCMRDGTPDPALFDQTVGALVRTFVGRQPLRAFGAMVDVLWAEGNAVGALRLEELWTTLQRTVPFSLLCAYPADRLADPAGHASVCTVHDRVFA